MFPEHEEASAYSPCSLVHPPEERFLVVSSWDQAASEASKKLANSGLPCLVTALPEPQMRWWEDVHNQ